MAKQDCPLSIKVNNAPIRQEGAEQPQVSIKTNRSPIRQEAPAPTTAHAPAHTHVDAEPIAQEQSISTASSDALARLRERRQQQQQQQRRQRQPIKDRTLMPKAEYKEHINSSKLLDKATIDIFAKAAAPRMEAMIVQLRDKLAPQPGEKESETSRINKNKILNLDTFVQRNKGDENTFKNLYHKLIRTILRDGEATTHVFSDMLNNALPNATQKEKNQLAVELLSMMAQTQHVKDGEPIFIMHKSTEKGTVFLLNTKRIESDVLPSNDVISSLPLAGAKVSTKLQSTNSRRYNGDGKLLTHNSSGDVLVLASVNKSQAVDFYFNKQTELTYELIAQNHQRAIEKWKAQGSIPNREPMSVEQYIADLRKVHKHFDNKAMYFKLKVDDIGRTYNTTTYVNPQGDAISKAQLRIGAEPIMVEKGSQEQKEVMYQLAEMYDQDKLIYSGREQWVRDNWKDILNPKSPLYWNKQGENSLRIIELIKDIGNINKGIPINPIIYKDATSSGFQNLSLLMNDPKLARMTNVNGEGFNDLYTEIIKALPEPYNTIKRSAVKKPLFHLIYGGGEENGAKMIREEIPSISLEEAEKIYQAIMKHLDEEYPSIPAFNNAIKKIIALAPNADYYEFKMPNGFIARSDNRMDTVTQLSATTSKIGDDATTKVTMATQNMRKNFGAKSEKGSHELAVRKLKSRILHATDAWIKNETVRNTNAKISAIHDSYGSRVNDVEKVKRSVKNLLKVLNESDIFTDIANQITGKNLPSFKLKNSEKIDVEGAEYFIS